MSLEKRRETAPKKKESLKNSTFRQNDFTPLQAKIILEEQPKPELEPIPVVLAKNEKELEKIPFNEVEDLEYITKENYEGLSIIEQDVLKIAEKVLKLKRFDAEFEIESKQQIQKYPIIEKLYAKCIAKLSYSKGYSKDEIFLAIRSLEEKKWIVTNERRTKLEIIQDDRFQKILNFIKNNPGIHARDDKIEKELRITRTPFLKHIMTLERFKLIRSKKIGKTLHYFLMEVPDDYDKYKVIFLNPIIPQIIEEFFREDSISISKMGERLGIYAGTIQYHVKKMKELDLIKSKKNSTGKKIHLINIELLKKYNDYFDEPNFMNLLIGL
ncbi:MAG: winged helix-turn-helix transcriptional regulator [Promethearchaeota archaeon]